MPGYAEIKFPQRSPFKRLQEVSFQQFNKSPSVRPENVFNFAAEKERSFFSFILKEAGSFPSELPTVLTHLCDVLRNEKAPAGRSDSFKIPAALYLISLLNDLYPEVCRPSFIEDFLIKLTSFSSHRGFLRINH